MCQHQSSLDAQYGILGPGLCFIIRYARLLDCLGKFTDPFSEDPLNAGAQIPFI